MGYHRLGLGYDLQTNIVKFKVWAHITQGVTNENMVTLWKIHLFL